jgi:hypothetical protein
MPGDEPTDRVLPPETPEESLARLSGRGTDARGGSKPWVRGLTRFGTVVVVTVAAAVVVWFLGVQPPLHEWQLDHDHLTALGSVVDTEGGEYGTDQVTVRLLIDGTERDYAYTPPMFAPGPALGSEIEIEYLADNPSVMRQAGTHEWFVPLLDAAVLVILVGWLFDSLLQPRLRRRRRP